MIKYLDYYFFKKILFVWLKSMELPFEDIKAVPLDSSMVQIKVCGYLILTVMYAQCTVHNRKLKGVPQYFLHVMNQSICHLISFLLHDLTFIYICFCHFLIFIIMMYCTRQYFSK